MWAEALVNDLLIKEVVVHSVCSHDHDVVVLNGVRILEGLLRSLVAHTTLRGTVESRLHLFRAEDFVQSFSLWTDKHVG